jgi:lipoprotein-anchoring transpeptidase ErfK/SrfK
VCVWPIGQAVSSGGIRMPNLDIVDLTNRVPVGAHVTVGQV